MDPAIVTSWRDFYLTIGTAAASLIGLLFVALSLNPDLVTHQSRHELRALAEQAFNSFASVLLIALIFLIPGQSANVLGTAYLLLGAVASYRILRRARVIWQSRGRNPLGRTVLGRFALPAVAALGLIAVSVGLLAGRGPDALYWLVWVIIGLLLSAARSSWDLLVKVGDERRAAQDSG